MCANQCLTVQLMCVPWLQSSDEGQLVTEMVIRMDDDIERSTSKKAGRRWQLAARAKHNTTHRLHAALTLPGRAVNATVFAAVHDNLTPPSAASMLCSSLGTADAGGGAVWFNTGHWPNLIREEPLKFSEAVIRFVKQGEVAGAVQEESRAMERTMDWARVPQERDCWQNVTECVLL